MSARRGGCLAVFWTFLLLAHSLVVVGILLWLRPLWLERLAFWKGPILPPEVVVTAFVPEDLPPEEPPPSVESRVIRWAEAGVRVDYHEAEGAEITTIEGTRIQFPPGSIEGDQTIEVVPITHVPPEMSTADVLPVGPLHELRIGDRDHWRFARPVRFTAHVGAEPVPAGLPAGQLAVATWEEPGWRVLPSHLAPDQGTISAEVPHASIIGIVTILTVAGGGSALKFTSTGQALAKLLTSEVDSTYKTKSFAIHYRSKSPGTVPSDKVYPGARGRPSGRHPLFVQDIGTYLEEARTNFPRIGINLPPPDFLRWDVFLLPLSEWGSSGLGGPILLDNDFKEDGKFPARHDYLMRVTSAHELIHVAQDQFFNISNAPGFRWWIEMTAEYLSARLLADLGHPNPAWGYYMNDYPGLLATPIDKADGLKPYAYARFLELMADRGVDVKAAVGAINSTANPNLIDLDYALREAGGRRQLREHLLAFAHKVYHESFWTEEIVSADGLKDLLAGQSRRTYMLTRQTTPENLTIFPAAQTTVRLGAHSSRLLHFFAEAAPSRREARLVVAVSVPGGTLGHRADIAQMTTGTDPPYPGAPPPLATLRLQSGAERSFVSRRVAAPAEQEGDVNRVALILSNLANDRDGGPVTIGRWLLMAPESAAFERQDDESYKVTWPAVELEQPGVGRSACSEEPFAGYNVYRREWSQKSFPKRPLNAQPVLQQSYVDRPPKSASGWAYTVTVVDRLGNESAPAPLDPEGDPFEGTWKGRLRLVDGEVSDLVARAIASEIRGDPGAAKVVSTVRQMLRGFDLAFRLGIPVTFEVAMKGGAYVATPRQVYGQPVQDPEPIKLVRSGRHTLGIYPKGQKRPVAMLRLHRQNEIQQTFSGSFNDPDIGPFALALAVNLEREPPKP